MNWNADLLKEIIERQANQEVRLAYIVTNDKEEFLERMEGIAKRGLQQNGDNLKCLEILDKVKAVREGADVFETFTMLKEWHEPEC